MTKTRRDFLKIFGMGAVSAGTLPLTSLIAAPKQVAVIPQVLDLGGEKPRWVPEPPPVETVEHTTRKFLEAFEKVCQGRLHFADGTGDDITNIFDLIKVNPMTIAEFPIMTYKNVDGGEISNHVHVVNEQYNERIQRFVDSKNIKIPTNRYYNSVSIAEKYLRAERHDVMQRAMRILQKGLKRKLWMSGWELLMASAVDRNILVFDNDACRGQLTTRLIALMKTIMRRNGDGLGRLTDLYVSPTVMLDFNNKLLAQAMYSSSFDNCDKEIIDHNIQHTCDNVGFVKDLRIFGVNIHEVDELEIDWELVKFFKDDLGGCVGSDDSQLVVGLDKSRSSFVMPETKEPNCYTWVNHTNKRVEMYLDTEIGLAVLDNQSVILGSL